MSLAFIKPLVAMLATTLMCAIFSVSLPISAAHKDQYNHQITIKRADKVEETRFTVDGKIFDWSDLSEPQQVKINQIFVELDLLEDKLESQTQNIESQASIIEAKALFIEKSHRLIESADFSDSHQHGQDIELQEVSRLLETKMNNLQNSLEQFQIEIEQLEMTIPQIDQSLINAIEDKAHQVESILLIVAGKI